MPELPDITIYVEALRARVAGTPLATIRLASPFLLRTVQPSARAFEGKRVRSIERLGKRIVFAFDGDLRMVVHLMKAGRFKWVPKPTSSDGASSPAPIPKKLGLAAFDFERGTLILTEAGTKKRASLHLFADGAGVAALDPGGLEVMTAPPAAFAKALRRENHTLKRALTDPRILSGIGNAYSDEILHRARLSPVRLTSQLDDAEVTRLRASIVATMDEWTERLRDELGVPERFPDKVTAFRDGMRAHGRYGKPCPVCGSPIQRIVYAESETNYCATCQTGGKLLADRSLSRLLHEDWPRSLDELEERKGATMRSLGASPPLVESATVPSPLSVGDAVAPVRGRGRRPPRAR